MSYRIEMKTAFHFIWKFSSVPEAPLIFPFAKFVINSTEHSTCMDAQKACEILVVLNIYQVLDLL